MNTPAKSPSTPNRFPESVPKTGKLPNLFSHLSVPDQTETSGPSSGIVSVSKTQKSPKDRTPSPKPESTKAKSVVFSWEATKLADSGTSSTKPMGGLFGLPTTSPSGNGFGAPSPKSSSEANTNTKAPSGGLFSFKPSAATGSSLFANTAANSPFGGATSAQSPFIKSLGPSKTAVSQPASVPAGEGTSETTSGRTSTEGSGLFAGIAPAKNDNSLK